VAGGESGGLLVDLAGEPPGGGVVSEVHAGGGHGEQSGLDAVAVHQLEVFLGRPGRPPVHPVGTRVAGRGGLADVGVGDEVGVDVDQAGFRVRHGVGHSTGSV